ncbi:alpha/beta fold hydrolase [Geobacter sp. FeAm09]|uniref:alpha/beta fold hydrolase n=1 Tax=Geobacter sp. FeAm09 TaxID=2597769 RepID=UPI0011EC6E3F|nr:alpha/beta fold hydrolase [Geobacter sp. FeAm09]QEM68170.1 alpha/beta fold hydrolase [Geobacter sp. FeAm09]
MPWYEGFGGERLWYREQGEGPALVLVHGWCMSSAVWRFQFDQLSAGGFRVIAPDLRGHGDSPQGSAGCRREVFVADVAALFRHIDLRGALLAGWSLGTQVAIGAVPLLRERLAGVALICGTPCFTSRVDFPHGLAPVEAEGMALKVRRNLKRALEGFCARMFAPGELDASGRADEIRALVAGVSAPETEVALQSLAALAAADVRPELAAIDRPTLVISGELDPICPSAASAYMAQRLSACRPVVYAGCGHAPFMTRCDEFNAQLADFSREVHGRV